MIGLLMPMLLAHPEKAEAAMHAGTERSRASVGKGCPRGT